MTKLDLIDIIDNLVLTSTNLSNLSDLIIRQVDVTATNTDKDNFSKLYTLINYNKQETQTLNDNLEKYIQQIKNYIESK